MSLGMIAQTQLMATWKMWSQCCTPSTEQKLTRCKSCFQVTHSYGDKSDEALLQFYGFVETDNPHDVYTADIADWVTAHHRVETERWQFLETSPVVTQSLKQVCPACLPLPLLFGFALCCLDFALCCLTLPLAFCQHSCVVDSDSNHQMINLLCCIQCYMHASFQVVSEANAYNRTHAETE